MAIKPATDEYIRGIELLDEGSPEFRHGSGISTHRQTLYIKDMQLKLTFNTDNVHYIRF